MTKYQTSKIKSIKKLDTKFDRYDLTVGETSNFLANGILIHNTSAIHSNILCKKPFNVFVSLGNLMGMDIPIIGYTFVYSSRSILKNRRDGKFTDDVWGITAEKLSGKIPEGYSVYSEIVGFTPTGKTIQKGYDYSAPKNECDLYVYKVVYNLSNGEKRELEWYEIEEFCDDLGLKTVPLHYAGFAKDLFADTVPIDDNWHNNFLVKLKETYLDKTCQYCTTGVVNEGVVIRIENNPKRIALKFKSPLFNLAESSARDNGEVDMEEES